MEFFLFLIGMAIFFGTVTGIIPAFIVAALVAISDTWETVTANKVKALQERRKILELELKLKSRDSQKE